MIRFQVRNVIFFSSNDSTFFLTSSTHKTVAAFSSLIVDAAFTHSTKFHVLQFAIGLGMYRKNIIGGCKPFYGAFFLLEIKFEINVGQCVQLFASQVCN